MFATYHTIKPKAIGSEPQIVKVKLIKVRFTVQSPTLIFISAPEKGVQENIISNLSRNKQKGLVGRGCGNRRVRDRIGEPRDFLKPRHRSSFIYSHSLS